VAFLNLVMPYKLQTWPRMFHYLSCMVHYFLLILCYKAVSFNKPKEKKKLIYMSNVEVKSKFMNLCYILLLESDCLIYHLSYIILSGLHQHTTILGFLSCNRIKLVCLCLRLVSSSVTPYWNFSVWKLQMIKDCLW
jgi:hypothetical protein